MNQENLREWYTAHVSSTGDGQETNFCYEQGSTPQQLATIAVVLGMRLSSGYKTNGGEV